ncbi:MAG: EthD family reductase [Terriglobia bacterium]
MIIVSVMYPKTSESTFDMKYYVETHTPLVQARLSPIGMESLHAMRGTGSLDGGPPPFEVIAQLQFGSVQQLQEALTAHGAEIIGDIAKFTNVQPVMQINEPL